MKTRRDPDVAKRPCCLDCGKRLRPLVNSTRHRRTDGCNVWHESGPPFRFLGYGWHGRFCGVSCAGSWALRRTNAFKAPQSQMTREEERAHAKFLHDQARELRKAQLERDAS